MRSKEVACRGSSKSWRIPFRYLSECLISLKQGINSVIAMTLNEALLYEKCSLKRYHTVTTSSNFWKLFKGNVIMRIDSVWILCLVLIRYAALMEDWNFIFNMVLFPSFLYLFDLYCWGIIVFCSSVIFNLILNIMK